MEGIEVPWQPHMRSGAKPGTRVKCRTLTRCEQCMFAYSGMLPIVLGVAKVYSVGIWVVYTVHINLDSPD